MYIFKLSDGSLVESYQGLDPDKPDFSRLADVQEVLGVNKVLEKQIRLVPKPKEERSKLLETHKQEAAQEVSTPVTRFRTH